MHAHHLPKLTVRNSATKAEADLIFVFQDRSKKAILPGGVYAPLVEKFRKSESFIARMGSFQWVPWAGKGLSDHVMLVGLGALGEVTEEKARQAGGSVWSKLTHEKIASLSVHMDPMVPRKGSAVGSGNTNFDPVRIVRAFVEGMILAAYRFEKYKEPHQKKKPPFHGPEQIQVVVAERSDRARLEVAIQEVLAIGIATNLTRDWSNEPSNYGTPEYYANESKKIAKIYGLKCRILTERDAAREKMGLFLGVGRGSEREGRIVIMEYRPKGVGRSKKSKTIALVGKGITFDSGGISIKPALRMEEMKHDMTGAATLMGALMLASMWKSPNRIVGIFAFTENMPDGTAIQPGNVITSRAGKTVEIINTDAEGRLILADVLDYAQEFKPDVILDSATLTGAVSVALGKHCCAILGTDDSVIEEVRSAGMKHGERIWQLPLYDEYFEDLKSDVADMKNSANDGLGGTIRGAIFLKQFIKKNTPWVHLDIAATAYNMSHLSYCPKRGGSGKYVRAVAQFCMDF